MRHSNYHIVKGTSIKMIHLVNSPNTVVLYGTVGSLLQLRILEAVWRNHGKPIIVPPDAGHTSASYNGPRRGGKRPHSIDQVRALTSACVGTLPCFKVADPSRPTPRINCGDDESGFTKSDKNHTILRHNIYLTSEANTFIKLPMLGCQVTPPS